MSETTIAEIDQNNTYYVDGHPCNKIVNIIVVDPYDLEDRKSWWDPLGLFTGKRDVDTMTEIVGKNHSTSSNSRWVYTEGKTSYDMQGYPPSIGYHYLQDIDLIIGDQPHASWIIDVDNPHWRPPFDVPNMPDLPKCKEGEMPFRWEWSEENYQSTDQLPVWILYQGMHAVE